MSILAPNPTTPVTVKAEAGGIGADSKIVRSVTSGDDLLEGAYADGLIPDVVVARGIRTPSDNPCAVWLTPALVRIGMAGSVTAVCGGTGSAWSLALLDAAHGMEMYPASWTVGVDKVPPRSPPTTIRAIPVAVRVLVGSTGNLVSRQKSAWKYLLYEIEDANTIFTDSRVGMKLEVNDTQTVTPSPPTDESGLYDCADGDLRAGWLRSFTYHASHIPGE